MGAGTFGAALGRNRFHFATLPPDHRLSAVFRVRICFFIFFFVPRVGLACWSAFDVAAARKVARCFFIVSFGVTLTAQRHQVLWFKC